jgi:hypothetical protein
LQLTELLFQKVKDLGPQGQLALRPGYVAIVSKAAALRAALVAPLFPGPDDQRKLVDGSGPTRVGVGMLGGDGTPYRVLRELGGARTLQRFDAQTQKFANVTEDQLEIDSFLRVECGLPAADAYTGFFVLEVNELPSLRGKAAAAAGDAYVDQARVKALRDELEVTRKFEGTQDRLFKVQQRLLELRQLDDQVKAAEAELAEVEAELGRSPWTPEEMADLAERASHAKDDLKKRDEALAELVSKRQRALRAVPPPPDPFLRNPWFGGGIAAGIVLDLLAVVLRRPYIALFGLVPFATALVAVLRFLHDDEADKDAASWVKDLKDREDAVKRAWDEKQAPLRAALRSSGADSPGDLLELFKAREAVGLRRDAARVKVEQVRAHPELPKVAIEVPILESEKAKLEDTVQKMGFSRAVAEIEADLRHAMGLSDSRKVVLPDAEVPKNLIARAAELMNLAPEELWDQMGGRLSAYLTALTDKRVVVATPDAAGLLVPAAADGRSGPYLSLPLPLRDLVYAALRLTLLEKVAAYKRVPVVVDDAFATLEAPKRALVAKMLKGISSQTQIIHRSVEPPPAATADLVLKA